LFLGRAQRRLLQLHRIVTVSKTDHFPVFKPFEPAKSSTEPFG